MSCCRGRRVWGVACGFFSLIGLLALEAAIEPVAPVDVTIPLVPNAQKKVMNLPTYEERLNLLVEDRKTTKKIRHDKYWRQALPLVLTWKTTEGEKGPWKIMIGKKPDLSDARVWYKSVKKTDTATGRVDGKADGADVQKYEVPYANLEINATYYWRVCTRGRCNEWNCGPRCSCDASKKTWASPIASFKTEDFAPRWIAIEGRVSNIRDLGGRKTLDGRRVKQGMVYRGQGLNDNSITGEGRGRNRLTMADAEYLTGELGWKTDLDLRSPGETADLKSSPLGPNVKFILRSSACYAGIFAKDGMKIMADNFRVFCDEANYPIYFHCIGGADRTGALGYVINGILGVDRHELETDWEETFYPTLSEMRPDYKDHTYWCGEWHFNDGFSKYGDANTPWNKRIELYLLDCGVTQAEIDKVRAIMLE